VVPRGGVAGGDDAGGEQPPCTLLSNPPHTTNVTATVWFPVVVSLVVMTLVVSSPPAPSSPTPRTQPTALDALLYSQQVGTVVAPYFWRVARVEAAKVHAQLSPAPTPSPTKKRCALLPSSQRRRLCTD
jgi:hypothetical protein